ncbi:hypothetical protein pb186bvf_015924, partial [Paramecium bursaria]
MNIIIQLFLYFPLRNKGISELNIFYCISGDFLRRYMMRLKFFIMRIYQNRIHPLNCTLNNPKHIVQKFKPLY